MTLLDKAPAELAKMQLATVFDPDDALTEAEMTFCRWLAVHPHSGLARQAEKLSEFSGTPMTTSQVKMIRRKPGWAQAWYPMRGEYEDYQAKAKEMTAKQMPRAARLLKKSLDVLEGELNNSNGDQMGAVRALPPSWPRCNWPLSSIRTTRSPKQR